MPAFLRSFFRRVALALLLAPATVSAHDANLATYQIRYQAGQWQFELMVPLPGLERSLTARSGGNDLPASGSTAYKEHIVALIKHDFDVRVTGATADGKAVTHVTAGLGRGRLRLDDHMSVFVFEITGMPERVDLLDFRLPGMAENAQQNNILYLVDGEERRRYILNAGNDFSGVDRGFFMPGA